MPLLDRAGLKADLFRRVGLDDMTGVSHALVAWVDLPDALARRAPDQRLGVEVPNALKAAEIGPVQQQLSLVAIRFPASGDGRGFSLARQLRRGGLWGGFAGRLRAVGPLIADQFPHALACGFDEVEVSDEIVARQPVFEWLSALGRISLGYQRGYGDAGSILDRRRSTQATRSAARP